MEIVLASKNLHKVREFREMFKALKHIDLLSLHNFPDYQPPPEAGASFKEIATTKALHAAQELDKLVLADDSGLVVPILGGAPGLYSHRFAGNEASDADNRKKLLALLEGKKGIERSAYFECCLALADKNGLIKCVIARCEGLIAEKESGSHGFGYDSLFVKHDYDKTFAELGNVKNRVSHRGKAFELLAQYLGQKADFTS